MAENETPDVKAIMESLPTRVALNFAHFEPGDPNPPEPEKPLRLAIEDPLPKVVVVTLQFSEKGYGFGEVVIKQTADGVFMDAECMRLDRVKRYFMALLDGAIMDSDEDPVKHARYNQAMGRSCGAGCPVCYLKS